MATDKVLLNPYSGLYRILFIQKTSFYRVQINRLVIKIFKIKVFKFEYPTKVPLIQ